MCKGLRPTVNEDIFRVSSPVNSQQNISIFDDSSHDNDTKLLLDTDFIKESEKSDSPKNQESSNIKWSCFVCTYLNWPKSKHCVQCLTVRTNNNGLNIPENEERQNTSKEHSESSESFLASNNIRSPIGSITNLASSKDIVWDEKGKNKWICHVSYF